MDTGEALSSPLEAALTTVAGREEGAPVTAAEVADDLDCPAEEARTRLDRLADRGRLATRQVGGVHVWWRPPGGADDLPGDGAADAALREEKAFASGILDNQRDVVYAFGVDGDLRRWNDRLRAVTGYTDAEIEEMEPLAFVAPRAADRVEAAMARVLEDREPDTVEAPLVTADGEEIPYEFSGAPMTDDGTVVGITGIGRDVSDRRARRRELRQERDLVERIFEASPVAIALFDADGNLCRANARAEDVLVAADADGYVAGDLRDDEGRPLSFEETAIGRTLSTGEPVTDLEVPYAGPDGDRRWLSVTTRLLDGDGDPGPVLVTAEDVTRLKEQARELRRRREDLESELADVFDRVDDAFYALDDEMRFTYVNGRAEELLGHAEADLLGRTVWEALDVAPDDPLRDRFETAMATQEPTSFERESEPLGIWAAVRLYPSESGLSVYFTDATDRKARERELEESRHRYRTLVENFPNGAVALVDEQLRYVTIGGTPIEGADATAGDRNGSHVREVLSPALADLLAPRYAAALDGDGSTFEGTFGGRTYRFRVLPVRDDDGEVFAAMGMSQDVTEQKARERTLREAKLQLEAATEAGAVGTWEWHVQEDRFVAGAAFASQFGVDPDAAREGVSLDQFVSAIHEDDRERVERKIDEAVASCGDYEAEYRVLNADGEYRWVAARGHVECDDGDPVTFPGALVDITERKHAEQELQRHRERLAVLNGLNEVVREVTDAVVERSTRAEIERATCEALAAADSYEFAWIGSVDPATGTVTVDAEAGVDGYLDDLAISIAPDGPGSHGPTARAVRTRELQVSRDVRTDPDYEPWRSHAREHGYRSSAAIPIVHEGSLYGALNVYSARPQAFDEAEREVVGGLGEVVGHAIAAVERKHALASDEVVEVSFHAHDVLETLGLSDPPPGRVSFDHAVAADDGGSVDFGTADPDARPLLEALVAGTDRFDDLTVLGEDGGTVRFQIRLSGPSVLLAVASLGGYVERAVLADGDFRLTVLLPPSVDVQTVADAVTALYPSAELVRRRTRVRRGDGAAVTPLQRVLHDELTDRQRTVLETAFYAGYFESPRHATAEELAAALDISSPTLSHHLRRAEKTVLASIFGDSVPDHE